MTRSTPYALLDLVEAKTPAVQHDFVAKAKQLAEDAGVTADLHVFEGLSHAGYMAVPESHESISTYQEISLFLKTHLSE